MDVFYKFLEQMGGQYQVILILAVSFIILVVFLNKILFKPLIKYVDGRRDDIQNIYTKIDADKKHIAQLSEEYQAKISQIEKEAYQKIQSAVKEGLTAKTEIISEAHLQADNVLRKAKDEIGLEKDKAIKEMRQEIIALSISAAEKIINKEIDEKTNSKVVAEFLEEIDKKR